MRIKGKVQDTSQENTCCFFGVVYFVKIARTKPKKAKKETNGMTGSENVTSGGGKV